MSDSLATEVVRAARELAADHGGVGVERAELRPSLSGTWIVVAGEAVVKVHVCGVDDGDLAARLRLAADPVLHRLVLAPLVPTPIPLGGGAHVRWVTVWPRVDPLPHDTQVAPWSAAGALLAGLHRAAVPAWPGQPLPVQGSVTRCRAALDRLSVATQGRVVVGPDAESLDVVRRAAALLPEAAWSPSGGPGRPNVVVHGDWHLGQLGQSRRGDGAWCLIDVDDLGVGDPVWDLGRPAAFWAAGLMPDVDWGAFVGAYRAADGPALPPEPADPWPALDVVARACVVLATAGVVRRVIEAGRPVDALEGVDARMLEVCRRLLR